MMTQESLVQLADKTQELRSFTDSQTRALQDFTRRMELILSQNHRKITVRDNSFPEDFAAFCTSLRKTLDSTLDFWQQARQNVRESAAPADEYGLGLAAKSFSSRAKTLSRSCDEFTSTYDTFNRVYKNYTLAKLPVWLLTSCCDDINNLTGKILFLSRELIKKTSKE